MEQKKSCIVDEIFDQWKRDKKEGKEPSIEEYLERYPEHAEELREVIEGHELVCALHAIIEKELGFTKEEAGASFEKLKRRIDQERVKMTTSRA